MKIMGTNHLKKGFGGLTLGIVVLIISLLLPAGLYAYNGYMEGKNTELQKEIETFKIGIEGEKKDPNVQVYQLVSNNAKTISKLESYSQITKFMKHMKEIEKKYKLSFEQFNYANGIIQSKGTVTTKNQSYKYITAATFIKEYREDPEALFTLNFINRISGNSEMEFGVEFTVKEEHERKKAEKISEETTQETTQNNSLQDLSKDF